MKNRIIIAGFALAMLISSGCRREEASSAADTPSKSEAPAIKDMAQKVEQKVEQEVEQETVSPVVRAARSQVGVTVSYDPAYVGLSYPGGDLPREKGVCTDVVIRALRDALDMDLQKLVHEDMKRSFSAYPKIWGLTKPDRNIDHRRVPNLMTYLKRRGCSVAVTHKACDYLPGDLVTCTVGRNLAHIMIVSDRKGRDGTPMVIHNIGGGTQEEARLFRFPITGHYRIR